MSGPLFQSLIYLCAAVIAVPLAKRLGLGSVLGYLIAGILIGPVTGLVGSEEEEIQQFAQLGVVMMLFLVGLELEPRLLWEMRTRLLGLGGLQVAVTATLIAAVASMLGMEWRIAVAIGLIFSLSSTAIVLQTLNEKGLARTEGGRSSFSVLLFQDLAVIPILALIPLLAPPGLAGGGPGEESAGVVSHALDGVDPGAGTSLVADLPGWGHALVVLGAVAVVLVAGRFLSHPWFHFIAKSRLREIFTASSLLLVVGITWIMGLVGLSPALGTFLAGVVLANSEYRHELVSDIEPFKGLLLGLFFITVGARMDFSLLFADLPGLIDLTLGLMLVKGLVLFGLAQLFQLGAGDGWLVSLALTQAGELCFVLLSFSVQSGVIDTNLEKTLSLVVALSMLLTPALLFLYERLILPCLRSDGAQSPDAIDERGRVLIAGNGRFGRIINRLLVASGVPTVVLEREAALIDTLRQVGIKSYYGDASRPDLLHAAGIEDAAVFVIAIDDPDCAVEMVKYVRRHYPGVRILARAIDVNHLYMLKKAGVDFAVRELFDGSLRLGMEVLRTLGIHPFRVEKMAHAFRKHDQSDLDHLYELWDQNPDIAHNKNFQERTRQLRDTLREMMETDRLELHDRSQRGWTPPPKGSAKEADEPRPQA
jgi:monovalent cation:proton antiporter-2 (CPA2) family protein